jgi:hypothetical protein
VKFAARAPVETKPNAARSRKPTVGNICSLNLLKRNREIICPIFDFFATIFHFNKYDISTRKMFMFQALFPPTREQTESGRQFAGQPQAITQQGRFQKRKIFASPPEVRLSIV